MGPMALPSVSDESAHLFRRQSTQTVYVSGNFYQPYIVGGQLTANSAFNSINSPSGYPVIDYLIYVLGHEVRRN